MKICIATGGYRIANETFVNRHIDHLFGGAVGVIANRERPGTPDTPPLAPAPQCRLVPDRVRSRPCPLWQFGAATGRGACAVGGVFECPTGRGDSGRVRPRGHCACPAGQCAGGADLHLFSRLRRIEGFAQAAQRAGAAAFDAPACGRVCGLAIPARQSGPPRDRSLKQLRGAQRRRCAAFSACEKTPAILRGGGPDGGKKRRRI